MEPGAFEAELDRRLRLLEQPESEESFLEPLPTRDVWLAVAGLAVLVTVMLCWGYPG